jgi:hypothetical protein
MQISSVRSVPQPARSPIVKERDHAVAILNRAAAPALDEGIENLRASLEAGPAMGAPYSTDQLESIVHSLITGRSLAETASAAGLDTQVVVRAVTELGTWLTHVLGSADIEFVAPGSLEQPTLFPVAPRPQGKKAAPKNHTRKETEPWEINLGFEPSTLGRDITASLGSVLAAVPSRDELERFHARSYRTGERELTYEVVACVGFFARLGRLAEVREVNAKAPGFHRLAIAAHDLLEVGRRDALTGLATLLSNEQDYDVLERAAAKAANLFEREMSQFGKYLAAAKRSEDSTRLLERERGFLAHRVVARPSAYAIGSIGALTDGQVLRLVQAAGLPTERDRTAEHEARRIIAEMGMGADTDLYLTAAAKAVRDGRVEEFRNSVLARI